MALSSPSVGSGLGPNDIANTGAEAAAVSASPPRLMLMLCDGALTAMHSAKAAQARGDVAARGIALSNAIAIVAQGLRPALEPDAGDELVASLVALYEYIANRLRYANLKGDAGSIDEAARLLADLRGAWEVLARRSGSEPVTAPGEFEPGRGVALGHARI
jgi:flagellar protein FliS